MADSEAKIANIALRQLRASPIASLDDDSDEARLAKELFADARDFVLDAHPWNFAVRRQKLNQEATAPAFGFTYSFTLPTDPYCIRTLKLNGSDTFRADGDFFKVEGRSLLCEESTANLLYIARITDVLGFSPRFVQTLAGYLAAQMAYPLTGSSARSAAARDEYERMLRRARLIDGSEDYQDDAAPSPFIAERQGGGGFYSVNKQP